jgi:hypothetical protein
MIYRVVSVCVELNIKIEKSEIKKSEINYGSSGSI